METTAITLATIDNDGVDAVAVTDGTGVWGVTVADGVLAAATQTRDPWAGYAHLLGVLRDLHSTLGI